MEFGRLDIEVHNEPHVPSLTVVLDLDETLVHTYGNITQDNVDMISNVASLDIRNRLYIVDFGREGKMVGVQRTYLRSFLNFCSKFFKYVIVYSAGAKNYVHSVVKKIFKGLKVPDMILTREDCITLRDNSIVKSLDIVVKKMKDKGLYVDKKDIVFIDDNEDYIRLDRPNAINIPAYNPSYALESIRKKDTCLLQILIALAYQESVDKLVKAQLFNRTMEQEEIDTIQDMFEPLAL